MLPYTISGIRRAFLFTRTVHCFLHRSLCDVLIRDVDHEGIQISWNDKHKHYYHSVWLRHNCRCPLCLADHSEQKTVEPMELVNSRVTKASTRYIELARITCTHVTLTDDNVNFTWVSDNSEHEGFIPLQWLKQNCYSEETLNKKREAAKPTVAPKVFSKS